MPRKSFFWRSGIWSLFNLTIIGFILLAVVYIYLESTLPSTDALKNVQLQIPLQIYSNDNKLIGVFGEMRRNPISLDQIPKPLVQAVLATEDQRFFEHPGVDIYGLARAALQLLRTGTKAEGGSTITMQVARNFFLTRKKTFTRKINEILLAIKIEQHFDKRKILELYLNQIYFGYHAYGISAAAEVYFGKKLQDLTLAEMAMIAGLPQAPSRLNPINDPIAAKERRNHVLSRMLAADFIDKATYEKAIHEPITATYHGHKIAVNAPYVAEMVREAMVQQFGDDAYTKGYKVYTTIDSNLQVAAAQSLHKNLLAYDKRHGFRGNFKSLDLNNFKTTYDRLKELKKVPTINDLDPALVLTIHDRSATALIRNGVTVTIPWEGLSWTGRRAAKDILRPGNIIWISQKNNHWQLEQIPDVEAAFIALNPKNGAIKALVGGFNFYKSNYNRVTQAERQPGSSFKPFIYAAGLEKGYTLATIINDAPIVVADPSIGEWRPQNYTHEFYGPTRIRIGLMKSRNLVSIRLLDLVGIPYTVEFLERLGFKSEQIPKTLSLALGTASVTPLQLTVAYAVFANGGYKIDPYIIERITDIDGNVIAQSSPLAACDTCDPKQQAKRVISPELAYLVTSVLKDVIQHGTATPAKVLARPDLAGKTGTTNDQVDTWFAGYNSNLVAVAWIGFDLNKSLHEYSITSALPIWIDFMRVALAGQPIQENPIPQGIIARNIDPDTGLLANSEDSQSASELFMKDHLPTQENSGMMSDDYDNESEGSSGEQPLF